MAEPTQCPSTRGSRSPAPHRDLNRVAGTSQPMWRSLEEFGDAPEFRDFVEREFPAGASELLGTSRRDFMKVMGASLALAGAATIPGCRRPDHRIMPYSAKVPEEVIPGQPLYYATSMPLPGGGAEGLLVETHEGRPTKIEGNPLHPLNQGKSSVWAQAAILELYDPDRLKYPIYQDRGEAQPATWDDFFIWWNGPSGLGERLSRGGGRGVAILANRKSSPMREYLRDRLLEAYPNLIWAVHEPAASDSANQATALGFGGPQRERLSLDRAAVVVSVGRDFLNSAGGAEGAGLVHARQFAASRRVMRAGDTMSRLYVAESDFTITGAQADHRLALTPSRLVAFTVALARELAAQGLGGLGAALEGVRVPAGEDVDAAFVRVAAGDLLAHRGESLVLAGAALPPEAHALALAMNQALGNIGRTVAYSPVADRDEASPADAGLRQIAQAIGAGAIDTLICLDANPVYDAPAELDFAALFARVPNRIALGFAPNETGAASTWQLNRSHFLESWGDTRAHNGTIAPVQPMIAPLFEPAMSEEEFLAWMIGDPRFTRREVEGAEGTERVDGLAVLRAAWQDLGIVSGDFERRFKRILHNGVVPDSADEPPSASPDVAALLDRAARGLSQMDLSPPAADELEVLFVEGRLADGRFANNAWLQELPATGTRVAWDNPAVMSPATARRLGVMPQSYLKKEPEGPMVALSLGRRRIEAPVWILPGMADGVVRLTLGYGREVSGLVGTGVGFNVYPLRSAGGRLTERGCRLEKLGRGYFIASTQNHWSLEGRDSILRQMDRKWWAKYGDKEATVVEDEIYGRFTDRLSLGEKLGERSHTPPNIGIYPNPYNKSGMDPDPQERFYEPALKREVPPYYAQRPQWGMSIDLTTCIGCDACTIACQAENNIPVVGKKEVAKGREMQWIRVDRYFTGEDAFHPDEMVHQPVACVHCENAPCESVCPVNATAHGPEGLNMMAYNRCIGTRYCANNCPYKVRRFNWFDYGVKKFNGAYVGEGAMGAAAPENKNLIPPRLREKLNSIEKMRMNPDVTVRSRGVMEKCSFCVQRINHARFETKLQKLEQIPDGFFQTACQQACPSDAIVFGDLLDEGSRVRRFRDNQRSYLLLGFLNTRPRTTHMLRIRNPHPDLVDAERLAHDPLAHGEGHGGEHDGPGHEGPVGEGHSFLHEPRKRREDEGYALSLRVLGAATGIQA